VIRLLLSLAFASFFASPALAADPPASTTPRPGVIELHVDATDLDRKVVRVRQTLPASPGPLTLYFPRWVPGAHSPIGDIGRIAGLTFSAAGRPLAWTRDTLDTHALKLTVPPGATAVEAQFEFLSPVNADTGRVVVTREMLNLQWNDTILYPGGYAAGAIRVHAELRVPEGWTQGSALRVASQDANLTRYEPTTLERLIDSPVFAGRHYRRFELDAPGTPRPVALNLWADDARFLQPTAAQIDAHRRIVQQADKLFGARPFTRYEFLFALTDEMGLIGLEHLESSENAARTRYWDAWDQSIGFRELLTHEYAHAWNGKYRRPADLSTPTFHTPMQNTLLWVYEGQTEYWGKVLAARAGLVSPELMRDGIAQMLANSAARVGRRWRDLQDTTNGPIIDLRAERTWRDWTRDRSDYYTEAALMWLEADLLIREKSGGNKSLDDFALAFFAATDGGPGPRTYRLDDVVRTLNAVQPHHWATFLRERLELRPAADLLAAFEQRSGWRLAWSETPGDNWKATEAARRWADHLHSIGLRIAADGKILTVAWESPAFQAGAAPGATLLAVNGLAYSAERLQRAMSANKDGSAPIELLMREGERFRTLRVDYRGGVRYPRLEKVEGTTERVMEVLRAR
jgi:predicted metalloprotease with PDZ domain